MSDVQANQTSVVPVAAVDPAQAAASASTPITSTPVPPEVQQAAAVASTPAAASEQNPAGGSVADLAAENQGIPVPEPSETAPGDAVRRERHTPYTILAILRRAETSLSDSLARLRNGQHADPDVLRSLHVQISTTANELGEDVEHHD